MYLLEGGFESGEVLLENEDVTPDNHDSRISTTLEPGDYTIEVSTHSAGETGDFTLTAVALPDEDDGCTEDLGVLAEEFSAVQQLVRRLQFLQPGRKLCPLLYLHAGTAD